MSEPLESAKHNTTYPVSWDVLTTPNPRKTTLELLLVKEILTHRLERAAKQNEYFKSVIQKLYPRHEIKWSRQAQAYKCDECGVCSSGSNPIEHKEDCAYRLKAEALAMPFVVTQEELDKALSDIARPREAPITDAAESVEHDPSSKEITAQAERIACLEKSLTEAGETIAGLMQVREAAQEARLVEAIEHPTEGVFAGAAVIETLREQIAKMFPDATVHDGDYHEIRSRLSAVLRWQEYCHTRLRAALQSNEETSNPSLPVDEALPPSFMAEWAEEAGSRIVALAKEQSAFQEAIRQITAQLEEERAEGKVAQEARLRAEEGYTALIQVCVEAIEATGMDLTFWGSLSGQVELLLPKVIDRLVEGHTLLLHTLDFYAEIENWQVDPKTVAFTPPMIERGTRARTTLSVLAALGHKVANARSGKPSIEDKPSAEDKSSSEDKPSKEDKPSSEDKPNPPAVPEAPTLLNAMVYVQPLDPSGADEDSVGDKAEAEGGDKEESNTDSPLLPENQHQTLTRRYKALAKYANSMTEYVQELTKDYEDALDHIVELRQRLETQKAVHHIVRLQQRREAQESSAQNNPDSSEKAAPSPPAVKSKARRKGKSKTKRAESPNPPAETSKKVRAEAFADHVKEGKVVLNKGIKLPPELPRWLFSLYTLHYFERDWVRTCFKDGSNETWDINLALDTIEQYEVDEDTENIRLEVRDCSVSRIVERIEVADIDVASLKARYAHRPTERD